MLVPYGEPLSAARTPLAAFLNSLLDGYVEDARQGTYGACVRVLTYLLAGVPLGSGGWPLPAHRPLES